MALGRGVKPTSDEKDGYLSDESAFYGDETTKEEFEARAAAFSPKEWWSERKITLMEISKHNLAAAKDKKTPTLYNPYEGCFYARQLNETVEEFLERLPPATTPASGLVPWIFIANPYRKSKQTTPGKDDIGTEGPPDEGSDWAEFGYRGRGLLKELGGLRTSLEEKNPGKAKIVISRMFNVQKDKIVKNILDTAVRCKLTSGKWMIFATADEVNAIWRVIAKATVANELGTVAKVAPDEGVARKERLICIYTYDFTDVADVTRVAKKLKELQLIDSRGRGIFYKCDAYTALGLTSSNEYGIKASMYNSNDILQAGMHGKGKGAKLDGFFYSKKKDTGDWN